MSEAILKTELEGLNLINRGKVRDIYDMGDRLLIVSSDRISAFDCIMPQGIPGKGRILTRLSLFWFDMMKDISKNHLITADVNEMGDEVARYADILEGRTMLVHKAEVFPIECIVRGYLAGSGWKEYQKSGTVCGISVPQGLKQADKLPDVIFTPSTKAESGHDENITFEKMCEIIGQEDAAALRDRAVGIYTKAAEYALERGVILADTKFEFGKINGEIAVVDEMLTPDSSRFWPVSDYEPGQSPPSFDKQYLRDYLETLDWDKNPPAPDLPDEVVSNTLKRYEEAVTAITG